MRGMTRAPVLPAALLAVLLLTPAAAQTPEETYFATRAAAIAEIKAATAAQHPGPTDGDDAKVLALNEKDRAELERQMRVIVGPVEIKGMSDKSALNLDALSEGDEGFGLLDGMVYGALDARTRVIVTTDSVFRHWLDEHKDWEGDGSIVLAQNPADAVKEEAFYSQAVSTDAAIMRFADLPIRKPPDAAFAYAMLAARSQDDAPTKANEVFVALSQGGRTFVAYTKEFSAVGPIPACEKIRTDYADQAAKAARNPALSQDQVDALSAKSDSEFLRCFAQNAARQAGFAAAAKAAQTLIDRLPMH
jgi:hypothetical protein